MDTEITDTVTEWESVPVGSGYAGLQSLADEGFSGAVTADLAWAFFLNGRIVGVFEGDIEEFDGTDLSAYAAPDPSLPLLFAMQEIGGETRAQYYTKDTPLREVDRTLSKGSFSGYVELSENVLSGDYYVVYHGGRSMSVAFVGASRRLVTDEEAFELAADEVGIYDVNAVDVDVVEIPGGYEGGAAGSESAATEDDEDGSEDEDESGTDADGVAGVGVYGEGADDEDSATDEAEHDEFGGDDEFDAADGDAVDDTDTDGVGALDAYGPADDVTFGERDDPLDATAEPAVGEDEADEADVDDPAGEEEADAADEMDPVDEAEEDAVESVSSVGTADTETETEADTDIEADTETETETDTETAEGIGSEAANGSKHAEDASEETPGGAEGEYADDTPDESAVAAGVDAGSAAADDEIGDDVFSAEQQWREARQIPALSPDETMEPDDEAPGERDGTVVTAQAERHHRRDGSTAETASTGDQGADDEAVAALEEQVRTLEATLESTESERDDLAARVEELEGKLESITRERDKYRVRVADLESELERLREVTEASGVSQGGERLSPAEARKQTNLFIRYRSKGKPTLEKARAGNVKQSEVVDNLRVEYHTTFDSDTATVDGTPYEEFLHSTTEWGFAKWVAEELLYEIGRSGNRTELAGIFDRIPEIDRVQFDGEVPVTIAEDGGESHESRSFDLVFRDTMGDPLFVADVDTSRNATSSGAVNTLIQGARAVGDSKDTLGGAFYVTTSFFDSGALDAVGEATGGGLLSRSSKKSFVKVSRKQGYHLCLVEARGGEYHLSVPEL